MELPFPASTKKQVTSNDLPYLNYRYKGIFLRSISINLNIPLVYIIIVKITELARMEKDDFYDKLPYTLPPEQANPEYVIFGTGLQECLIAAYKTKL